MAEALVRTDRLNIAPLGLSAIEAILDGDSSKLERLTDAIFPRPAAPPPYMTDPLPVVASGCVRTRRKRRGGTGWCSSGRRGERWARWRSAGRPTTPARC